MAVREVIVAPDPRLKAKCAPVEAVDDEVRQLMNDMLESMHASRGIGLAAPQIGVHKRVIVCDVARDDEPPRPMKLANPEIVWRSDETITVDEGCLSLPEHYAEVTRPAKVKIRYLDHQNEIRELDAEGVLSTCLQHEMDHLDGILFVDHLSMLKRKIILRKLAKLKRQEEGAKVPA
ncbi:MAG: peptide deformylase [Rhodospirillales bacterium]